MQVKIMMLLSDEKSQKLCRCAETILNEVAGAFEHQFSIFYEKIGAYSQEAYELPLTEETVEACEKCQGILLGNMSAEGVQELLDALEMPFTARYFGIPQALCGRHERGFNMWLALAHSLDADSLDVLVQKAVEIAAQNDLHVTHVRPNGAANLIWQEAMQKGGRQEDGALNEVSAEEAIRNLIEMPSRMGTMVVPPYAGRIYMAAAVALNPMPVLMHDIALSDRVGVYGPAISQEDMEEVNPIPMILSLADLLRYSFGLKHEADCVNAAVQNVLEAGWRTADILSGSDMTIDARDMVDLVCEQISLAGQLMYHSEGKI